MSSPGPWDSSDAGVGVHQPLQQRAFATRLDPIGPYVESLVRQLLLTDRGERVNRPTLGAGLLGLVFASLTYEQIAATEFLVRSSLQEWLGGLIQVDDVACVSGHGELTVTVAYALRADGSRHVAQVQR